VARKQPKAGLSLVCMVVARQCDNVVAYDRNRVYGECIPRCAVSLRDYDKWTPKERRDRAILRAEMEAKRILPAARAQDPDPASLNACQENSGSHSADVCGTAVEESVDARVSDTGVSRPLPARARGGR
jgi:hypothetical protein